MPGVWRAFWRRITLSRLESELWALRLGRRLWPFPMVPILGVMALWWGLATLPIMVTFAALASAGINMFDPALSITTAKIVVGFVAWLGLSAHALVLTVAAAPWVFRWYGIALGLTFGRGAMVDRTEAELVARIAAAKAPG